jgi:2-iminobutanoate/2-iminopropanoate deaminase
MHTPPIAAQLKQQVQTDQAPSAIGPYSQAIRHGGLIFVSGQIPFNPATGSLVQGEIAEQTAQCLRNLQAILEAGQSSLTRVLKTTVYLKDMEQFTKVNEIYGQFFKPPFPARACVEVARLPRDVGVEIDCIATCD